MNPKTIQSEQKVKVSAAQSCLNFATPWSTKLLCPWDSPGKNTRVGCHFLLQGIIRTQGSNPGLLHWRVNSFLSEPPGKPSG